LFQAVIVQVPSEFFFIFSRNHSSELLTISLGLFAFNQAVLTLTVLVCEILSNPSKENHPSASGEIPEFSTLNTELPS
jgi:hypothetical protein